MDSGQDKMFKVNKNILTSYIDAISIVFFIEEY